jgi:hypothetical protein
MYSYTPRQLISLTPKLRLFVLLYIIKLYEILIIKNQLNYCLVLFLRTIVIFILSARRECFLCMKRSFTPRRRSRQYKPLNAQKHIRARNINNIFSIIDSKN